MPYGIRESKDGSLPFGIRQSSPVTLKKAEPVRLTPAAAPKKNLSKVLMVAMLMQQANQPR